MPQDVFISYQHEDQSWAERVCRGLEKAGVSCWIAPRDIPPGAAWAQSITEGIKGSRALILILSGHSASARQISREVEMADAAGLQILPVRVEDVQPPPALAYFLRSIQWLDAFRGDFDAIVQKLASRIRQDAPSPANGMKSAAPIPPVASASETRPVAYKVPAILGALLVLLFATWGLWHKSPVPPGPRSDTAPASAERAKAALQNGEQFMNGQHWQKAMIALNRAIQFDPNSVRAHFDRGQVDLSLDKYAAANDDFTFVIEREPKYRAAYQLRAKARSGLGNAPGAEQDSAAAQSMKE